jgi:hypothetical protein
MAGWICAFVSLLVGYSFLGIVTFYTVSGICIFVLALVFDTLMANVQVTFQDRRLDRACNKLAFASGGGPDCAKTGLSLIEPANMPSKPAHWTQFSRDHSALQHGRCFVLADTSAPLSRRLSYDLSIIGYDVDMCDDYETVMGSFQSRSDDCRWSLLVVDLDFLTCTIDLEGILDDLLTLRTCAAHLTVVVISSSEVGRDDNGISRLSIADVSLRAPVSMGRLVQGLWSAKSNNSIWQSRVRDVTETDISPPSTAAPPQPQIMLSEMWRCPQSHSGMGIPPKGRPLT